ncbi:hypothetical protein [Roseateles violae]|uniref:Uncharacterized protein n=1 Tax=Roseateles violae TaxID=3058042 RepID=A0ABT8DT75_9BURK|nr:hypothetical protein [Pelomonas sp. PFR6]MDN3921507.1 hypothetical protein [Pelomonas sp. PFR6]
MFQNFTFDGGGRQINAQASYIRYEAETSGAINALVRIRADGQDLGEWLPGDSAELPAYVTMIEVTPVAGAVGSVRIGVGKVSVSRVSLSGQVGTTMVANKLPTSAAFANTAKTVTNASAQLLAASGTRAYLLIQNKDSTGSIWINFGAAATQANGIRIGPGGNYEPAVVPTGAIYAIGDLANNANVLTVEG